MKSKEMAARSNDGKDGVRSAYGGRSIRCRVVISCLSSTTPQLGKRNEHITYEAGKPAYRNRSQNDTHLLSTPISRLKEGVNGRKDVVIAVLAHYAS